MIQFCANVQKPYFFPYFYPFLGPFCPKSREREFSQIWDFRRKLANHNTLHFRSFLAKTNDSIFRKSPKTLIFCPFLDPFCPFLGKWEFPEKSGSVTFLHLWSLNFMQKNKKLMNQSWELCVTDGRTSKGKIDSTDRHLKIGNLSWKLNYIDSISTS